ncbi:hypothetical protein PJP10_32350, partial [Mycobacterium kansasii]
GFQIQTPPLMISNSNTTVEAIQRIVLLGCANREDVKSPICHMRGESIKNEEANCLFVPTETETYMRPNVMILRNALHPLVLQSH